MQDLHSGGHELTSFMFQNNIFYNGPQECQVDQGGREAGTKPEEDGQGAQEVQGGGGLPQHQVKAEQESESDSVVGSHLLVWKLR